MNNNTAIMEDLFPLMLSNIPPSEEKGRLRRVCVLWNKILGSRDQWEDAITPDIIRWVTRACGRGSVPTFRWLADRVKMSRLMFSGNEGLSLYMRQICLSGYSDLFQFIVERFEITLPEISTKIISISCFQGEIKILKFLSANFNIGEINPSGSLIVSAIKDVCRFGYHKVAKWALLMLIRGFPLDICIGHASIWVETSCNIICHHQTRDKGCVFITPAHLLLEELCVFQSLQSADHEEERINMTQWIKDRISEI